MSPRLFYLLNFLMIGIGAILLVDRPVAHMAASSTLTYIQDCSMPAPLKSKTGEKPSVKVCLPSSDPVLNYFVCLIKSTLLKTIL